MNTPFERAALAAFLFIIVAFALFPIYWMGALGLKSAAIAGSSLPFFLFEPTMENFRTGFVQNDWLWKAWNSLVVAVLSTIISLLLGVPCAYGFARFKIVAEKHLKFWILSVVMMPPVVAAIPIYFIWAELNLLDTHLGLAMAHSIFNLPLVIWLMAGFFEEVPREIEESAEIDGCNRLQTMLFVSLPAARSGLATVTTLSLILSWNELLFATILTRRAAATLPPAISDLWRDFGLEWGQIGAITLVATIPVLIIGFFLQKHLVRGLTLGAVKE